MALPPIGDFVQFTFVIKAQKETITSISIPAVPPAPPTTQNIPDVTQVTRLVNGYVNANHIKACSVNIDDQGNPQLLRTDLILDDNTTVLTVVGALPNVLNDITT